MSEKYFFACPVCKGELLDKVKSVECENGHCFDKAKQGYVNLLLSQKSSKSHHGDDRLMIEARQGFLDKGYYKNLCNSVADTVLNHAFEGCVILDAGCGDGYYLSSIYALLKTNNINASVGALDISKEAVKYTLRRINGISGAVGSVFSLPIKDNSVDILLNIFSPMASEEYRRVIGSGGVLISVTPGEEHLFELKKAVYDNPLRNDSTEKTLDGFTVESETRLTNTIEIDNNEDLLNLFMMTPYYYKTGIDDQNKLKKLNRLTTQTVFDITVYKKN
ncbi:MAG: methyltransferase domain-containing protein [Ruminococcaceae bacterium]|nr:methyltransferase domain-containing protein [Oscillospiraceae bacterium]